MKLGLFKFIFLNFLLLLQLNSFGQNLIAHYSFDNSSALDISGNNNHGEIIGGVQSTSDRFKNPCGALLFNGYSGYIEVPNTESLKLPVKTFSATCWFKMENTSIAGNKWLTLICKGTNAAETAENPQYRVQVFQSNNQSTISINSEFTEYDYDYLSHLFKYDEWNFYAMVYDGENVKTYLNGIEVWKFPYKNPLVQNEEPLNIAKDIPGATEFFSGSLDDLRIYSSALTASQLTKIYKDDTYASFENDFNLICPDNIIVNNDKLSCFAKIEYKQPILDIGCGDGDVKQIAGLTSGSQFPIGVSTLVFEAESSFGIKKSCFTKLTVKDIEFPYFEFIKDTTLTIENVNKNGITFYYNLPLAFDNCEVSAKLKSGLMSGSIFNEGRNVLTFLAVDKSGNETEMSYSVNVIKNHSLVTTNCPNDIIKANDLRKCGANIANIIKDSLKLKNIKLVEGKPQGGFYKVGSTKNNYFYNDTAKCEYLVTIYDDEKPEIKCQMDTVIYINKSKQGMKYYYPKPIAKDNCKVDSVYQVEGLKSGQIFPLGITNNTFRAIDVFGNDVECSFKVTVIDTIKIIESATIINSDLPDSIRYYKQALDFNKCNITLVMYDDSKQDMDTVSVFLNGSEIVQKELILIKKNGTLNRSIILKPNEKNLFIFKAWNEGSISPNTLSIEFYEGDYLDNLTKLKRKAPTKLITMHSKIGIASAITLKCKN